MRLPEGLQAIVFDAVGTLLHPEPPAPFVYAAVGQRHGSRLSTADIAIRFKAAFQDEDEFDRRHGLRTDECREVERWRHIVSRVLDDVTDPEACFQELFDHFSRPAAWQCTSGTAETLAALAARGYVLGMASNYDRRLRSVVAGLPALHSIHHLVISSEVGHRKPAAEFFQALEQTLALPAAGILFVGDDLANDYQGAQAYGLAALLYDPAGHHAGRPVQRVGQLGELLMG